MQRNALLHILADIERRIVFCEAELAYRRARLDRVGQATRKAIDAIAGASEFAQKASAPLERSDRRLLRSPPSFQAELKGCHDRLL